MLKRRSNNFRTISGTQMGIERRKIYIKIKTTLDKYPINSNIQNILTVLTFWALKEILCILVDPTSELLARAITQTTNFHNFNSLYSLFLISRRYNTLRYL